MIPPMPPIAEPKAIPTRYGSNPFRPAWATASRPAARASRTLRSSLRCSFGEATSLGSKSLTSAATRTGKSSASNDLIQSIPLSPASAARHVALALFPSGETAPSPVTTTLRTMCALDLPPPASGCVRRDSPQDCPWVLDGDAVFLEGELGELVPV